MDVHVTACRLLIWGHAFRFWLLISSRGRSSVTFLHGIRASLLCFAARGGLLN